MLFIMFTGQGSQQLNMGKDFFDQFQVAKDTMLQCEEALCYKLSEKIFCDNAEDLNKTIHTQQINLLKLNKFINKQKRMYFKSIGLKLKYVA